MAAMFRLKTPKYAATTITIAAIIATFRNLCSRKPTTTSMTNGLIIKAIGGNPPILQDIIKWKLSSMTPIIATSAKLALGTKVPFKMCALHTISRLAIKTYIGYYVSYWLITQ
jgi:hypothetical protein